MKIALEVVGILLLLIVAFWAVSAALGYLVGIAAIAVIALAIGGLLRFWLTGRSAGSTPNTANVRRAERDAEKMLRRIERTATTAPTPTAGVETEPVQKPSP
jgi:uncharacterized membrane protein YqjE